MIQVYTGDGKGKTTAAFGLALRACGQGLKVEVFQFLKKGISGEVKAARKLGIGVRQYGSGSWLIDRAPTEEEKRLAGRGLEEAAAAVQNGCQVVILDEISHTINLGLLPLSALLGFVESLPAGVELVLTGRAMPEELIARADLVTEMKEVKHPYQKGIKARRGVEY
ncbi:MAG TPA: cob(I)yrinic acid a,c-diamide adenosyltransferase [Firmicutes bacterium]|jgi:cob(I)alamin adenosyltransferase|nr:cob(I)yrinic acid a,c-diamide adenosyltransferase [Bacillota bacterium]